MSPQLNAAPSLAGPPVPPSYEFSMKRFVLLAVVCLGVVFVGSLSAVLSYRQFADTDRMETAQPIACWTSEEEPGAPQRRLVGYVSGYAMPRSTRAA